MRLDAVGFVVAGGRSQRMGRDKALLPWAGITLLDHAVARLRGVCGDVRVLCGPEPRYAEPGLPIVLDSVADAGALGGVLSGLQALDRALGLFLAVDLPHVPAALLERLLALAAGHDAVVPRSDRGPEPLCAVYSRGCLDAVRVRVLKGDLKLTSFWPEVRVREVRPAEFADLGAAELLFANLNTPVEYGAARDARSEPGG